MTVEISQFTHEGQWAQERMIPRRRVVVTGIGMITPSGNDTENSWKNIIAGKSTISGLDQDQLERLADLANLEHLKDVPLNIKVAGLIDSEFDPKGYITSFGIPDYSNNSDLKRMPRAQLLSLAGATQALENAGLLKNGAIDSQVDKDRFATIIGTSIGGMSEIAYIDQRMSQGKKIPPTEPLKIGLERVAAVPSEAFKLRGPKFTPTDACATGSQAVIYGVKNILLGDANIALVGGVDASIEHLTLGMFDNMRALNRTDNPFRASTPFDKDRKGFVMAEGVGMMILESEEHARSRGANIIAEVAGYGDAADAYHDTEPSGYAAEESLRLALQRGGLPEDGLLYINAHGTSTEIGDPREIIAIRNVLEHQIPDLINKKVSYAVSSTKSIMGHTMGASGAIEAGIAVLALRDQILPPTIGLENEMEEGIGVDLVPNRAMPTRISRSGSLNAGFGGGGTYMLFKKYQP